MSKVEDASSRQVKRHRADQGLPRGNPHTKVNGFASINGVFQENVEHNSEVLRNLLNLNRSSPAKSVGLCSDTESQDSFVQDRVAEDRSSLLYLEEDIVESADIEPSEYWQDRKLECAKVPSESGDSTAMPTAETAMWEECNGSTSPIQETITDSLKAKRARVENIITSMRHSPPAVEAQDPVGLEDSLRKPKRKQYQPQPQRWDSGDEDSPSKPSRKQEKTKLKGILSHLQTQLDTLQEKYLNMYDIEDDGNLSDNSDDMDDLNEPIDTGSAIQKYEVNGVSGNSSPVRHRNDRKRRADGSSVLDRTTSYIVRQTLKEELPPLLLNAVDSVMNKLTKSSSSKNASNNNSTHTKSEINSNQARNPVLAQNAASPPAPAAQECKPTPPPPTLIHPSFFMRHFPTPLEQQTEAMSLVVPSRKRVRSNDHRHFHASSGFHPGDFPMKPEPLLPVSLPTSVAIPNPSLHPTLAASFMTPNMADPRDHFESLRYM